MKIVINRCYGGFGLSTKAMIELVKRNAKCLQSHHKDSPQGKQWFTSEYYKFIGTGINDFLMLERLKDVILFKDTVYTMSHDSSVRNDPDLVEVVEKLRDQADGYCAKLSVVEIPDDVGWQISDYDGKETVREIHHYWN